MSFSVKTIFSFLVRSPQISVFKRCIFSEKTLKIDHYRKEIEFHKKKFNKNSGKLWAQFNESINSSKTSDESFRSLNSLLFLSNGQKDLDAVVNGIKHLLKNNQIPKQQFNGLASNLMRCTYVLNEWEKGMTYLKDKDLEPIFKNTGYPRLILMNKLMLEKKYTLVVEIFETFYLGGQFRAIAESAQNLKPDRNKFFFPHDHFSLVTMALLKMNTPDALPRLKKIIDSIKLKNLEYCNILMTRCFVLAIKQNDPEYALKLTKKFSNMDCTVAFNLAAIAFSQLGFIDQALGTVQNILDLNFEPDQSKMHGKVFPFMMQSIDLAIESEPKTPTALKEKYQLFHKMITNDKRFLPVDISEYIEKEIA